MANWSDTLITIKGSEDKIIEAKKLIEKFIDGIYLCFLDKDEVYKTFKEYKDYLDSLDEVSFDAGFSEMEIFTFKVEDNEIFMPENL